MKRCAVCGNISEDKNVFCGNCGNRLGEILQEAEMETEVPAVEGTEEDQASDLVVEEVVLTEDEGEEALEEGTQDAEDIEEYTEEFEEPEEVFEEDIPEEEFEEEFEDDYEDLEEYAEEYPEEPEPPVLKSEPHIYGQPSGEMPGGQEFIQQGMIRRDVQGRTVMQGQQPYQMNQKMNGRPPRPMPGPQGRGAMHGPMQTALQIKDKAKRAMRSPLFFLIVLFNTVCLVGSVGTILMGQLNYTQVARMLQQVSLPDQLAGYANTVIVGLSQLDSGMIVVNLILQLPNILLCLGLWIIFFSAMIAARKETLSGVGFGFAKAYVIIHMIGSCLSMLACLVLSVAVVIATWMSGAKSQMIIAVIVLVLLIVVVMMIIMYYVSFVGTWNVCHVNGNTGDIYGKVSAYVAVIHIIMALFSIVGLLSGIVNNEIAAILKNAGSIGWMLFFAIWIFNYKGKMSEFEEE